MEGAGKDPAELLPVREGSAANLERPIAASYVHDSHLKLLKRLNTGCPANYMYLKC